MSQTREALDRFIAALAELREILHLPDEAALGPQLEHCLVAVRDGDLPDRGTAHGVSYQQHGIGFVIWWSDRFVDVDVDRAYLASGCRRLVLDPWKVAHCGARAGLTTDAEEAEDYLRELCDRGICEWAGEQYVWPPAANRALLD